MAGAGGAFGGSRGLQPVPPEKGVFPLDHFGECKEIMKRYMECLKENKSRAEACREITKTYLECRMERSLMAKQELSELGFSGKESSSAPLSAEKDEELGSGKRESGFIAGLPKKGR